MPRILVFEGYNGFGSSAQLTWRPLLKLGMTNQFVEEARSALASAGFPSLGTPNVFGPMMLVAVQNYQKKQGLVADGIIGAQTWSRLLGRMVAIGNPPAGSGGTVQVEMGEPQIVSVNGQPVSGGIPTGVKVLLGLGVAYALKKMVLG